MNEMSAESTLRAIRRLPFYQSIYNRLMCRNPSPEMQPYVSFVILANARTGTGLLRGALNQLQDCMAFGEVFNDRGPMFGLPGKSALEKDAGVLKLWASRPLALLQMHVFSEVESEIAAVGFKLLYFQARRRNHIIVRDWLKYHKSIKVVHIVRGNFLEQLVSLRISMITGKWVSPKNQEGGGQSSEIVLPTFCLSPDEVQAHFESMEHCIDEARQMRKTHSLLEITYEDLASNFDETMLQVQDFLGLSRVSIEPATLKMTSRRPSEIIENYDHLKSHFLETRWGHFFE